MSGQQFLRGTGGMDNTFHPIQGDDLAYVRFYQRSRRNPHRSEQEGRPVYEMLDFVKIGRPGEMQNFLLDIEVTEEHRMRWPKQWAVYEQNKQDAAQSADGMPIETIFLNEPRAVIDMLKEQKYQTVEQLAGASEHAIDRMGMDGRRYVAKAKAALDQSESLREVSKLTAELRDTKDQLKVVSDANARMQERIAALETLSRTPMPAAAPQPEPPMQMPPMTGRRGRRAEPEPAAFETIVEP